MFNISYENAFGSLATLLYFFNMYWIDLRLNREFGILRNYFKAFKRFIVLAQWNSFPFVLSVLCILNEYDAMKLDISYKILLNSKVVCLL